MLAAQVIYTNVEEDRSPHKRRGFQLWLWTKSLPKPVLEEVEQRVNTFARVTPAEAEQVRATPRRIYAPLDADGGRWVMLGEAVPLDGKDKFGRGGRFHAHALLFDRAEFEAAGGDPFRVFDGGFTFQRDPEAVSAEVWKTGDLATVQVPLAESKPRPVPESHRRLVAELVGWLLGGPQKKHVALPMPTPDAEAVVREVFGLLPPSARLGCGFDTLWTGRGKYPPALSGAGSAALLQAWTFRQFVRAEPTRTPGALLAAADAHKMLADWWVNNPDLTDADRGSGLALSAWVGGADTLPPDPTEKAVAWVETLDVKPRWEATVAAKVADAFPPTALDLSNVRQSAVSYFGGWGVEGLKRLARPIPTVERGEWVRAAVYADPCPVLTVTQAEELVAWKAEDGEPVSKKVYLAAKRWLPEYLTSVCDKVRTGPPEHWFRRYCRDTLPADMVADGGVAALVDSIAHSDKPPPSEAELCEAVMSAEAAPTLDRLRLLLRMGGRLGGDAEKLFEGRPELLAWAEAALLPRCTARAECVCLTEPKYEKAGWGAFFAGTPYPLALLGMRVPTTGAAGPLVPHLIGTQAAFLGMRPGFDPNTFPLVPDPFSALGQPDWKECIRLFTKKSEEGLTTHLRQAGDDVYRDVATQHLFTHACGRLMFGPLPDGRSYFVGAAVGLTDPNDDGRTRPLLLALARSAVPVTGFDDPTDVTPYAGPPPAVHRFRWLVARLLNPTTHGSRGIPT